MRTLPKHIFDALVQLGHALVTVVPANYRPLAIAAIPFVSALLLAYCVATAPTPTPPPDTAVPVKVLTTDQRDFDGVVVNGVLKERSELAVPIAPLMDLVWDNRDIAERKELVWCFDGMDPALRPLGRELINKVITRYAGLSWREACPGPYTITDLAGLDCGLGDGAVGCAAWRGNRGSAISYNGNLYRTGRCTVGCVRAALAHEVGHAFRLDHTACDNAEPTTMSGIYLPDGPACGAQGNPDFSWQDWGLAERYYGLQLRGSTVPSPAKVVFQRWLEANREHCPNPSGDFCISDNPVIPEGGAFYVLVRVHSDGTFDYPYPFVEITP